MAWLHDMVEEAVRAAEEADAMAAAVRQQRAAIERTFQLADLQVGLQRCIEGGAGLGNHLRHGAMPAGVADIAQRCLLRQSRKPLHATNERSCVTVLANALRARRQAGTALTAGPAEQRRWLHALDMLDAALSLLAEGDPGRYAGLPVRLLQPQGDEPAGWSVPTDSPHGPIAQQVALVACRIWRL